MCWCVIDIFTSRFWWLISWRMFVLLSSVMLEHEHGLTTLKGWMQVEPFTSGSTVLGGGESKQIGGGVASRIVGAGFRREIITCPLGVEVFCRRAQPAAYRETAVILEWHETRNSHVSKQRNHLVAPLHANFHFGSSHTNRFASRGKHCMGSVSQHAPHVCTGNELQDASRPH